MDANCCTPTKLNQEELKCLPMPILDSSGSHYLSYDETKLLKKADERDRPSLKIRKETKQPKNSKNALPSSTSVEKESVDLTLSIPVTAQNTRAVVYCVECKKPRVIYSKNKLNHNQRMLLGKSISSFEYSCRAFLFPPDTKSETAGTLCIRYSLQCEMQIEVPYYGSGVGRADICSHCGGNNAVVSQELKQRFKTVLPMCKPWVNSGKEHFTETVWKRTKVIFFVCKCNFMNGFVTPNQFWIIVTPNLTFILTVKS